MPLIHCIYASAATASCTEATIAGIVRQSQARNLRRGITGMLVYSEGSFFQVLEGEAADVDALFATIAGDPRHTGITLIIREPIARRAFARWSMASATVSATDLSRLLQPSRGQAGASSEAQWLAHVDEGRAKKLLAAFVRGRWRSRLSPLKAGLRRSQAA